MTEGEPAAADHTQRSTDEVWARTTAPQSPFTNRQVGVGLVVFAILAIVAFVVPLVLA